MNKTLYGLLRHSPSCRNELSETAISLTLLQKLKFLHTTATEITHIDAVDDKTFIHQHTSAYLETVANCHNL